MSTDQEIVCQDCKGWLDTFDPEGRNIVSAMVNALAFKAEAARVRLHVAVAERADAEPLRIYQEAFDEGYRRGVDAAAAWHDGHAAIAEGEFAQYTEDQLRDDCSTGHKWGDLMGAHRYYASEIRALLTPKKETK